MTPNKVFVDDGKRFSTLNEIIFLGSVHQATNLDCETFLSVPNSVFILLDDLLRIVRQNMWMQFDEALLILD